MKKFLLSLSFIVTAMQAMFGAMVPAPMSVPTALFDTAHVADVAAGAALFVSAGTAGRFDSGREAAVDQKLKVVAELQGYGYKTANLEELKKLMQNATLQAALKKLGVTAEVPDFRGISSPDIVAYLEANGFNLALEWAKIVEAITPEMQEEAFANKTLPPAFEQGMQVLGTRLKNFFDEQAIAFEQCGFLGRCWHYFFGKTTFISNIASFIEDAYKAGKTFIVRSTGMEDTKKTANAGGNDSFKNVTATVPDTLRAIGKVLQSYVGTRSLSQRFIAGDTTIFQLPQTPVLMQHFVKISSGKRPVECVVHTTEQAGPTPGLASFNCGYGVVESKERADQCYHFHTGHGHCILAKNVEHVSEPMRQALSLIAQAIEVQYQRATDIELLIDTAAGKIFIVQSRPLNRPATMASPSYIQAVSLVPADTKIAADTVVAAGSSVRHITDKKHIVSAQTLAQALDIYLHHTADKASVLAIVVHGQAEPNSHEATTFASDGKLVMIARDYEKFLQWLTQPTLNLYCDAQQGAIVASPTVLVVTDGYTKHPMPGRVSVEAPVKTAGAAAAAEPLPFAVKDDLPAADIATVMTMLKQGTQSEAERALALLLVRIDAQIGVQKNNLACVGKTEECPLRAVAADALARLDAIAHFARQKAHDAQPSLVLPGNDLQRLAAIVPLEALLTQPEDALAEHVYSVASVMEQFEQRKTFIENHFLPAMQESMLRSALRFLANRGHSVSKIQAILENIHLLDIARTGYEIAPALELKNKWIAFVAELTTTGDAKQLDHLTEMIQTLTALDAFPAWLSTSFSSAYSADSRALFNRLYTEYEKSKGFLQQLKDIQQRLSAITISDWAYPEKFDTLWRSFKGDVLPLFLSADFLNVFRSEETLKKIVAQSLMGTFIDTFDNKFIKAFVSSSMYESTMEKKVSNFKEVVGTYLSILKTWEPLVRGKINLGFMGFDVEDRKNKDLLFAKYIMKLERTFDATSSTDVTEFQVQENFNVNSKIFINANKSSKSNHILLGKDSFGYRLAELYTLVHQNINTILNLLCKKELDQLQRPALLKRVEDQVLKLQWHNRLLDSTSPANTPYLLGTKLSQDSIALTYNMPVVVHGITYDLIYTKRDNSVMIIANFVGTDHKADIIVQFAELGSLLLKLNRPKIELYDKGDELKLTFIVNDSSNTESLHALLQVLLGITTANVISDYDVNFDKIHQSIEQLFKDQLTDRYSEILAHVQGMENDILKIQMLPFFVNKDLPIESWQQIVAIAVKGLLSEDYRVGPYAFKFFEILIDMGFFTESLQQIVTTALQGIASASSYMKTLVEMLVDKGVSNESSARILSVAVRDLTSEDYYAVRHAYRLIKMLINKGIKRLPPESLQKAVTIIKQSIPAQDEWIENDAFEVLKTLSAYGY